jgi:hypothetical protein
VAPLPLPLLLLLLLLLLQGFAELEYGILCWMGAVDRNTPGKAAANVLQHTGHYNRLL